MSMTFDDDAPPLLQDATFPMGALTAAGRGGANLDPLLRAVGSGPIDEWEVSAAHEGLATHWTLPGVGGVVAAGPAARTPMPSSTGDSNNLAQGVGGVGGYYAFRVRARGPGGWSNQVVLTIPIDPNAASLGDAQEGVYDNYPGAMFSMTPTQFCAANSHAPKKLLLSVGANRGLSGFGFGSGFDFPEEVRIEYADPARPLATLAIAIGGGGSNFTFEDLIFDGPTSLGARLMLGGVTKIQVRNCRFGQNAASYVNGVDGVSIIGSTSDDIVIENCEFIHCQRGVEIVQGSRIRVLDCLFRYFHGQGIALGPATRGSSGETLPPPDDVLIQDCVIVAPYLTPGDVTTHMDGIQQLDDFEGYPAGEGGYVGNPTGVAQNVKVKNTVIAMADANCGMSCFRGGRAGSSSHSDNLAIDNLIITSWAVNALEISNGAGAPHIRNVAVWQGLTGDDTDAPFGSRQDEFGIGPNNTYTGLTADNWPAPMPVAHVHVYGDIVVMGDFADPVLGAGVIAYHRNRTNMAADYVVDPRDYLEAITDADYAAMDKATLRETHMLAFRRHDGTGPVDADGAWNTLSASFDSTATTFDNASLTWDRT